MAGPVCEDDVPPTSERQASVPPPSTQSRGKRLMPCGLMASKVSAALGHCAGSAAVSASATARVSKFVSFMGEFSWSGESSAPAGPWPVPDMRMKRNNEKHA